MSRHIATSAKILVPVEFNCPKCGGENKRDIKLSGYSRSVVDVHHPAKLARETTSLMAQAQIVSQLDALYAAEPKLLCTRVTGKCLKCGSPFPWNPTKEESAASLLESITTIILAATFLGAFLWFLISLAFGFSIYLLWYILAAGFLDALLLLLTLKITPTAKKAEGKKLQQIENLPPSYLPRLLLPKEMIILNSGLQNTITLSDSLKKQAHR